MTPEKFDNSESGSKVRTVTQDSMNKSANMGRKDTPASLSFEFENKPAAPAAKETPKKEAPKKEAPRPVEKDGDVPKPAKKETPKKEAPRLVEKDGDVSKPAKKEAPKKEAPRPVEKNADVSKPARTEAPKNEAPKKEAPKKQYGLPADYVKDTEINAEAAAKAERKAGSAVSDKFNSARKKLKRKIAERQAAAKIAKASEAERRRQIAKEQEAAKAAREAEAEYNAKLEAAVAAEMAAAAGAKKVTKPQKSVKQVVPGKVKTVNKTVKQNKAANKAAAGKTAAAKASSKSGNTSAADDIAAFADKSKKKISAAFKRKGGKKKKKTKKKSRFSWVFSVLKIMAALVIVGGIAGGAYAAITIAHADTIHPEQIYNTLEVSTHIYDDSGNLTDDIYLSENREICDYEELPENLKNAFVAIEDKTFWTHKGFNFKRIFGAIWNSVSGGGEISGTSTITQQLARNVFLPEEKSVRSIKRKIIEMYYAHEIEETLSKEEILTAYLNTIYLGYGCYGVDTAAKKYFGVDVEDLTLEQCAALAALPQAPGVYALLMTENDEAETTTDIGGGLFANDVSQNRRYLVLDLMAEQGYITAEEAETAKIPLADFINPGGASMASSSAFKDYLLDTVKHDLMEQYDLTAEQADKMIYTKGLNIYSTLDSQAQKVLTKEFKNKDSFPEAVSDDAKVEAAMVIVEVGTGQIKAMAGTRNAEGEKLFNRAISPRQPGSSIKPIAVYAPALQKSFEYQQEGKYFKFKDTGYDSQGKSYWGNYITTSSGVKDEKMKVNGQTWPQNFSRTYTGYKTFRQAIQLSINTCAIKILAQVGTDYSMEMVKKFGITTAIDDTSEAYNDVNLAALGLGAMTEGVTPLDMALAYAVFPNGGVHNSGICYTKVTDSDGNVLLEGKSEETKVLDEGVAFIMTDVLQTVVTDGIAFDAKIDGEKVGGKTGTTDDTWDIWFDGFTPNYAAALWIGTDNNIELNTTSATAAKLWGKIMGQVKRAKGGEYKSRPSNVIVKNGEYYTKGTEPPDPPPEKKEDKDKDEKADHSSTKEPDPNAKDDSGKDDGGN